MSATNSETVDDAYEQGDAVVLKNLAVNFKARRALVEQELVGGAIPDSL